MRWLALVLALTVTGCSTAAIDRARESEAEANAVAPANYKQDILALMRNYLNDPTHVRDAYVSVPAIRNVDGNNRYASCLRYNARKGGGQYAGSKDSVVVFSKGRLDRIIDNARDSCKDAAYQPFPELQRLTRGG